MVMGFTAYDKVHFAQYEAYQEYALLTPGVDSFRVAGEIFGLSPADDVVRVLSGRLNVRNRELRVLREEFSFYVVRNVSGVTFDVYFVDEDNLFLGFVSDVAEEDVLRAGERLIMGEHLKEFCGVSSDVLEVEGFVRVNGYMTILGSPVRVDVVRGSWHGAETVETVLSNGRCNRVVFKDGCWMVYGGRGAYSVSGSPSTVLRFYADGEYVVDVTFDMAGLFAHAK